MRVLLLVSLISLLCLGSASIQTDNPEIERALQYLEINAPQTYLFVLQNVREIIIVPTITQNSGEAYYDNAGVIGIHSYLLEHPEQYFPIGQENHYIACLITHEARHEWQYNHWSDVLQYGTNPIVHDIMEKDAVDFTNANCPT